MLNGDKIEYYRKKLGLNQKEFAKKLGIGHRTYCRIAAGTYKGSLDTILDIALFLGVRPKEIDDSLPFTHPSHHLPIDAPQGPYPPGQMDVASQIARNGEYSYIPYLDASQHHVNGEEVFVPQYRTQLSAGNGVAAESEKKQLLPFKSDWIRRELHANPASLVMVDVNGDSMEPTFSNGDSVLVDTERNDPRRDGVYAFRSGDDLFVKRTESQMGRVLLKSDNPMYENFYYDESCGKVIGRVVWKAGKVR